MKFGKHTSGARGAWSGSMIAGEGRGQMPVERHSLERRAVT